MKFRIVPLAEEIAEEVRRTLAAPGYGHPAHRELATGYGRAGAVSARSSRTWMQGSCSHTILSGK